MRYLVLLTLLTGCSQHVYHAHWDGKVWSCPHGTDTWVDEKEAVRGDNRYVYCIPQTKVEKEGYGH